VRGALVGPSPASDLVVVDHEGPGSADPRSVPAHLQIRGAGDLGPTAQRERRLDPIPGPGCVVVVPDGDGSPVEGPPDLHPGVVPDPSVDRGHGELADLDGRPEVIGLDAVQVHADLLADHDERDQRSECCHVSLTSLGGGSTDGRRRASTFQGSLPSLRRMGSLVFVTDPLRQASTENLFGELRRRRPAIDDLELRRELGLDSRHRDAAASLRTLALIALTVISLVLVAFIVWLTMDGTEIPDLISGLTGSAIGAIVGILSGGAGAAGGGRSPP
jgi:hypothetical protein